MMSSVPGHFHIMQLTCPLYVNTTIFMFLAHGISNPYLGHCYGGSGQVVPAPEWLLVDVWQGAELWKTKIVLKRYNLCSLLTFLLPKWIFKTYGDIFLRSDSWVLRATIGQPSNFKFLFWPFHFKLKQLFGFLFLRSLVRIQLGFFLLLLSISYISLPTYIDTILTNKKGKQQGAGE